MNVAMCEVPRQPAIQRNVGRKLLFGGAAALCLTPLLSAPIALALGAVLALTVENPFATVSQKLSKWLLQACVVLLGFGMNLPIVLRVGASGALFAAATIGLTLLLGYWLGKGLRMNPRASALISAGTAICGGSAIAAVGSALDADEGEMTVAMGTVFLLNAAALYLFPPLGHAMGLTQHQFGTWAGVAIHDVSSVVGAAKGYPPFIRWSRWQRRRPREHCHQRTRLGGPAANRCLRLKAGSGIPALARRIADGPGSQT